MLPDFEDDMRSKLGPDLPIIDGHSSRGVQESRDQEYAYQQRLDHANRHKVGLEKGEELPCLAPTVIGSIKKKCTVHLIEVGFCAESVCCEVGGEKATTRFTTQCLDSTWLFVLMPAWTASR